MGVQFGDLIPKREITLKDLKGKTLAIDGMNALYQFLSSIRLRDGSPLRNSKGEITSTYNGLFYKNIYMLEENITPVWVFDGEPPKLKYRVWEERRKMKEKAEEEYRRAKEEGKLEEMYKYAKRVNYLDSKIIDNSKRLLKLMGIPYIEAPSEGEAQCSYMVKKGDAYGVVSQDYDALLYGATRVVRNITTNKPLELIELEEVLKCLGITLEDLSLIVSDSTPNAFNTDFDIRKFIDLINYIDEEYEVVILDLPPNITEGNILFSNEELSCKMIVVGEDSVPGISGTLKTLELLDALGIEVIGTIINKDRDIVSYEDVIDNIIAILPYDEEVEEHWIKGEPIIKKKTSFGKELSFLARELAESYIEKDLATMRAIKIAKEFKSQILGKSGEEDEEYM